MADTLVSGQDLTGSGENFFGTTLAFTYGVVIINTLGAGRKMDAADPSRIFQFGWFALAQPGPGSFPVSGAPLYSAPVFIEWENMQVPVRLDFPFTEEYYADRVRFSICLGGDATLTLWHV